MSSKGKQAAKEKSSAKTTGTGMKGEGKPSLVPKLRFPEFRGGEGWEEGSLADACEMRAGKFVPASNISDFSQDGWFPCYGGNGLRGYTKTQTHVGLYPLIGRQGALCGNVRLVDGEFHATEHAVVATPKDSIDAVWLYYSLDLLNLNRFATGQAQPGLSVEVLGGVALAIPHQKTEQQKIAECLSSLDELIAAQARKVDTLKTHKKGLMQQLFPREGETQPRLRFPEFQKAGKWEVKSIGDLKPFVTSGSRGWAAFYANQGELFVRITNLWRDSIYLDLTDSKFVQLPPGANEGDRTQLKEHDVLISITADIGIIGYVDELVPSPAYINQHIALVRFDSSKLCGRYIAYFLASEESQRLFRASTDTGTKAGMNLIGIQKIVLMLPSLPEQRRIASCLSSLDALITAESRKLDALKFHKKGLMQQLFPTPEETEP